jgi:hypothetical protein
MVTVKLVLLAITHMVMVLVAVAVVHHTIRHLLLVVLVVLVHLVL